MFFRAASVLCLLIAASRAQDTTNSETSLSVESTTSPGGNLFSTTTVVTSTPSVTSESTPSGNLSSTTTVISSAPTVTSGSNSSSAIGVTCDGQTGPPGVSECVLLSPAYNDYQWATCLSSDYIRLISANKDHCQDPNAKYCWFQCMIENYNSMGPAVRGACRCSRNTASINQLALPSTCYSPDGSVCDWYSTCLAAKYQCDNTSAGSAFQYGFNFCRMYMQYYKQLSDAGQQWMDSVRRCLLGCMAPLLRQYNSLTCENVSRIAMASQASCYLGRGCNQLGGEEEENDQTGEDSSDQSGENSDGGHVNGKSICNLPSSDFFQIIQMVNNSFVDYSSAGESMCNALNTFWKCPGRSWNSLHRCVRNIVVSIRVMDPMTQNTTATPYAVPNRVTSQIAASQNWNAKGIQSLGCLTHWPDNTNSQLVINVVVVTKDNKNCLQGAESSSNGNNGNQNGNKNNNGNQNNKGKNTKKNGNQNNPGHQKNSRKRRTTDVDLDQIVSDFQKDVQSGKVLLNVDGKKLYVTGTGECDPSVCLTSINVTAAAPATPSAEVTDCNSQTGPGGNDNCVRLSPTYNDYQWATCLSNDYIRLISANKDRCQDPNAKYCWFQCMLENYNSMGPDVRGVCKCSPNANSTALALPSTCYSPDGSVCDWYSTCLAAKYQCDNTSAGNAFQYGFNFCRMYMQYYKQLSDAGQQWMDSVRRCLMGCMVPLLRPYNTLTCENATKLATATQASCYLGHGCYGGGEREDHDDDQGNKNSICNLPLSDFFQVIQMMNNSFSDYSAAGESLCDALNTLRNCAVHRWKSIRNCVRNIVVSVQYMDTVQPTIAAPYAVPSRITGQIAQSQNWNAKGLQTLGCLTHWPDNSNGQLTINVVVITKNNNHCIKQTESDDQGSHPPAKASAAASNRRKRSTNTTDVDLDQIVKDFQTAVQSGRVLLNVDGKPVYVTGTGECDLMSCSNVTAVSVRAPDTPAGSSRSAAGSTGLLLIAAIFMTAFNHLLTRSSR